MSELTPEMAQEAADDIIDAGLAVPWRTTTGEPAIKLTQKGIEVFFRDPEMKRRLERYIVPRRH